jgi:hypothetical protein
MVPLTCFHHQYIGVAVKIWLHVKSNLVAIVKSLLIADVGGLSALTQFQPVSNPGIDMLGGLIHLLNVKVPRFIVISQRW